MRRGTSILAVGLVITGLIAPFATAVEGAGRREQVLEVLDRRADAGLKRDVAAIDVVYSDDYFHTNPDGSVMDKVAVIAAYRAPAQLKVISSKRSAERIQLSGDCAVVSELDTLTAMRNADQIVLRYRVTYVLRRLKNRWKIVTSHASLLT